MAPFLLKKPARLREFNDNTDKHLTFSANVLRFAIGISPFPASSSYNQKVEFFDNDKEGVCIKQSWFPWILPSRN